MNSHARLIESVRRTRNTLYLVAGLYIVVGFIVAFATAMQRDRVGTFFGFVIISGALSMGLIARTALQVLIRIARIEESLDDLSDRIQSLVHLVGSKYSEPTTTSSPTAILDLSSIGLGNPAQLSAATLDRDSYPRLVTAMEQSEPIEAVAQEKNTTTAPKGTPKSITVPNGNGHATRTRDLLQQWKEALAADDLVQCRQVFSTLVDFAEQKDLAPLRSQIRDLQDRIECKLRERFTTAIRKGDYIAALQTGEKISALLCDRPVAAEFARLRPILARRADEVLAMNSH